MADRLDIDVVLHKLSESGIGVDSKNRMKGDIGWRVECSDGQIVNIYDTGSVVVQGKKKEDVEKVLGLTKIKQKTNPSSTKSEKKVFVVYGHDVALKNELEAMLRRWKLEPLILDELPSGGTTIIEKLERYTSEDVVFGVVLATPDDEGRKRGESSPLKPRVRQNVVLELGMLLARLGRKKVAILLKDIEDMEKPSDINGLIYLAFSKSLNELRTELAKEMNNQGIKIDVAIL